RYIRLYANFVVVFLISLIWHRGWSGWSVIFSSVHTIVVLLLADACPETYMLSSNVYLSMHQLDSTCCMEKFHFCVVDKLQKIIVQSIYSMFLVPSKVIGEKNRLKWIFLCLSDLLMLFGIYSFIHYMLSKHHNNRVVGDMKLKTKNMSGFRSFTFVVVSCCMVLDVVSDISIKYKESNKFFIKPEKMCPCYPGFSLIVFPVENFPCTDFTFHFLVFWCVGYQFGILVPDTCAFFIL
ncbi:hypothetical protein ACJX0J_005871, partial [Zea mays]